ncbi:IS1595 family transposase [Komagataeibacter sp. FXV3]|uniref:IS1595 family transposase n=1 Tax=Komagataeibacter sp. FXV3 TaxID=2608998 RepID=UPI00187B4520|nr:IS1595 family transposase [Komagataeibacter sp. FXV3]MBE7728397.1 IS1595 family transposase [Komagataeibacter sp. FXV3]
MKARRRCRLALATQRRLLEHFVVGTPARSAAEIVGVNRNTATLFYRKIREIIAAHNALEAPLEGEIEVDESYFGGHRKGKRGRGAAGKVAVFGLLKRGGRVHAVMIPDAGSRTPMSVIRKKIRSDSIVYSDTWHAYRTLDVSEFRHERINHATRFSDGRNHIKGIENFWSQAKRHLRRYNGTPRQDVHLFLAECEWRFNHRSLRKRLQTLAQWANIPIGSLT